MIIKNITGQPILLKKRSHKRKACKDDLIINGLATLDVSDKDGKKYLKIPNILNNANLQEVSI